MAVLCASCAGGAAPQHWRGTELAGGGAPGGLGLPAPATLAAQLPARTASFSPAALVREGADYDDGLPQNRVSRDADTVVFAPNYPAAGGAASGLAYATWLFSVPEYDGLPRLRLNFATPPENEDELYVGVGDFSRGSWQWFSYVPGNFVNLGDMAPFIDPSGRVLVVVLMTGTTGAGLSSIRLGDLVLSGVLTVSQQTGLLTDTFAFDAGTLVPNGGTVVNYEWDLDGDGTFELDSDGVAAVDHNYSTAGSYSVAVRVRTDEGLTGLAHREIRVLNGTWDITTLAEPQAEGDAMYDPQIAVIGGKPAVAYVQYEVWVPELGAGDVPRVFYSAATTADATTWSTPVEAVPYDWYANHLADLQEVNGHPALCVQGFDGQLGFARGTDPVGSGWSETVNVALDMDTGSVCASIAVFDGVPNIAYISYDDTEGPWKTARRAYALDAAGASWEVAETFANGGWNEYEISLADIDGPVVAYWNTSLDPASIEVFRSGAPDGGGLWTPKVAWGTLPRYISLGRLGDRLAVAYISGDFPRVLWASDLEGTPPWGSYFINDGAPSSYTSLGGACLNYDAVVCYQEIPTQDLYVSYVNALPAAADVSRQVVDDGDSVGINCNMVVCDGIPMIVYEEYVGYSVKLAVLR